jgi:hypothetical protein
MRLDAVRSSTYRIFAEYRADRPELQLEKRTSAALKAPLLVLTRHAVAAGGLFSGRAQAFSAARRGTELN